VHGADADREQDERPDSEADRRPEEDVSPGSGIGASRAEEVAAERRQADRPQDEQGERNRRAGERDEVTGAPVRSLSAQRLGRAVDECAAEPVAQRAVEAAADERPHRDDESVALGLVEQRPRDRGRQHTGDAGEPIEREHRLLPSLRSVVRVVAERREDGARRLQDEQRTEQPCSVGRRRLGVHM
jgi:hypothetical protein